MPPSDPLADTAARGVEAIHAIVIERDALRTRNERLEADTAMLSLEVESLKQRLALCSSERDHYMRYSTELVARLNNIQVLINDTAREAQDTTYRPPLIPKPKQEAITLAEQAQLEGLIARLPPNGGTNEAL